MKILLTGVNGFIGNELKNNLLTNGHYVLGVDITREKQNRFSMNNYEFFSADLTDKKQLRRLYHTQFFKKDSRPIDVVIHQAALNSVPRSINNPEMWFNSNTQMMLNLLMLAKKENINKFIWASSSSVYGALGKALSPYAASKQSCESLAQSFAYNYKMDILGLRYFNVFGMKQNYTCGAIIANFNYNLSHNMPITVYGDGNISRDYTHIDNILLANHLAINTDFSLWRGASIDIGCGESYSILNLIDFFKKIYPRVEINFEDGRKGDIALSKADLRDAINILKYKPIVHLEDGLNKLGR